MNSRQPTNCMDSQQWTSCMDFRQQTGCTDSRQPSQRTQRLWAMAHEESGVNQAGGSNTVLECTLQRAARFRSRAVPLDSDYSLSAAGSSAIFSSLVSFGSARHSYTRLDHWYVFRCFLPHLLAPYAGQINRICASYAKPRIWNVYVHQHSNLLCVLVPHLGDGISAWMYLALMCSELRVQLLLLHDMNKDDRPDNTLAKPPWYSNKSGYCVRRRCVYGRWNPTSNRSQTHNENQFLYVAETRRYRWPDDYIPDLGDALLDKKRPEVLVDIETLSVKLVVAPESDGSVPYGQPVFSSQKSIVVNRLARFYEFNFDTQQGTAFTRPSALFVVSALV